MSNSGLGFINPDLLTNCTVETCPIITSFYNYRIDLAPNATFLALFSLAVPWFAGVYLYTKRGYWFMTAMLFGLAAEIIGYSGRILSYNNQWDQNGFLIMTVCLTLGPAFFSAAIYLCLARIVTVYGAENSRLAPSMFTKIFIPCDIVAMVLQAAGGGMASVALTTNQSLSTSDNVITAGLSSQVFTLFVFMALCIDFGLRVHRRRRQLGDEAVLSQEPHLVAVRSSKWFLGFLFALGLATVLVFWRCCYRVAELNQGFVGPVTVNAPPKVHRQMIGIIGILLTLWTCQFKQNLFVGFEGILMVVAVALLAIFHPALCMGDAMKGTKTNALTQDGELSRSEGIKEKLVRLLRHSPSLEPDGVRKSEASKQIESNSPDGALKESNT